MTPRHGLIAAMALALAAGCAKVPRPSVVAEASRVSEGPAAREAKLLAPGAYAHADKLRREAEAAFEDGDHAGAQILGERSIAAYAHASALARLARAMEASAKAEAELSQASAELTALEADQAHVQAEVDALELKVRVARDAQPIVPSRRADPERERARLAAARALALQAHLLCSGARMLLTTDSAGAAAEAMAAPGEAVKEAQGALDQLTALLASSPPAAPIDQAARVRASCLAALTSIRRARAPVATAPGSGDALLAELSAAGALPSRDDRGVAVTLRDSDASKPAAALSRAAEEQLTELGRVAAAHPAFPVLVVVHLDKDGERERERARAHAEAVSRVLTAARAPKVEAVVAGAVTPIVDPSGKHRSRNARTEIVFVTPEVL